MIRRTDRIEAYLKAAIAVLVVALVPLSVMVGISTERSQTELAAQQARTTSQVDATTTAESAAPSEAADNAFVGAALHVAPATWTSASGATHTEDVAVAEGTPAGSVVTLWVDGQGNPTAPPITPTAVHTAAIVSGVFTFFAVTSLALCGYMGARVMLDRRRTAEWDREIRGFLGDEAAH
ncbi:hypothetical protein [Rhodococcus rhodnii]|nr:hypothetical protein [Rhodococcus rhodnii]